MTDQPTIVETPCERCGVTDWLDDYPWCGECGWNRNHSWPSSVAYAKKFGRRGEWREMLRGFPDPTRKRRDQP